MPMNKVKGHHGFGSVTVGLDALKGSQIKRIKTGTVSVNPAEIAATTRAGTEVTLTGAADGDIVILSPPAALNDDLIYCGCRVTDDNDLTIYIYNPTAGAIDDTARDWDYLWIDLT